MSELPSLPSDEAITCAQALLETAADLHAEIDRQVGAGSERRMVKMRAKHARQLAAILYHASTVMGCIAQERAALWPSLPFSAPNKEDREPGA